MFLTVAWNAQPIALEAIHADPHPVRGNGDRARRHRAGRMEGGQASRALWTVDAAGHTRRTVRRAKGEGLRAVSPSLSASSPLLSALRREQRLAVFGQEHP